MIPYAAVTFLAAFLLFFVQPLLAKAVLPWFGGAASVWTTSLVFYQTLLLGGYLYGHVSRRLGIRVQAGVQGALLLLTLLALPILPSDAWAPTGAESPTLHLLALLAASVGAPYLLLATTSPILHDWFGRLFPGRSPYPLYAVSNAGSLLALLAYPFAVEPLVSVDAQARGWAWAYGFYVVGMIAISLGVAARAKAGSDVEPVPAVPAMEPPPEERHGAPGRSAVAKWLLLSACGSGLLLALTNQMTLDVASVPFLWVMPLALYLATFILAFAGRYSRAWAGGALALGLVVQAGLAAVGPSVALVPQVLGGAFVLFAACWVCHGELARSAPAAEHLTAFYLTMSAGGALGGATVSLLAPAVLPDLWELPLFLLLSWTLLGYVLWTDPESSLAGGRRTMAWRGIMLLGLGAAVAFLFAGVNQTAGSIASERNFYGVLRVLQGESELTGPIRVLRHGRILHGSQLFGSPERQSVATAYYASGSGVHVAIREHPRRASGRPLRIGVIGEGVGTVATWGEPGDTVRFYEINPAVDRYAREYFTFLEDSRAAVEVVLGDGRLSLERDVRARGEGLYDVLVVDAFSGDAIPTHLLTAEAGELYRRALGADGVVAFHVTNRHLDLTTVVRGLAAHVDGQVVRVVRDAAPELDIAVSEWLLVTSEPGRYVIEGGSLEPTAPRRLWTDRFSNLLHVLR